MVSPQPSSNPDLGAGLDLAFLHRVYRTSVLLTVLGGMFTWEGAGIPSALGWTLGALLSLGVLAGLEWSVRRFIRPGGRSVRGLVWFSALKLVVLALLLAGAFYAATLGWLSLPWVLAGFALPHLVIYLKLLGRRLQGAQPGR